MNDSLTIEAIRRALQFESPEVPRHTYIVPDCWYEMAVQELKDLPIDIIKQSDTLLQFAKNSE